jgi:hydroxymethylglutaryl-CoA synthase
MAGILTAAAYVPFFTMERAEMGRSWGIPSLPGVRAVANSDEDSITMAVEAGLLALRGRSREGIDALYFATTTPPYAERQCAPIIAAALDLPPQTVTADFTGTTRAATLALKAAIDAVHSGAARQAMVVAADMRPGEPQTAWEQLMGDAGAAVIVAAHAPATIRAFTSLIGAPLGPWRRPQDRFVRSFDPRVETEYGYVRTTVEAARGALDRAGLSPQQVSRAILYTPDLRSPLEVAHRLGLERRQLQDPLMTTVGNAGAAHVLLVLAAALEEAQAGEQLLVANYGDGADAFVVSLEGEVQRPPDRPTLAQLLALRRPLPNYGAYAALRNLAGREGPTASASPVTYWRDVAMELRWHGARCRACGLVQFPIPRVCRSCGARDQLEEVPLSHRGTIYTFTLDHLYAGEYLDTPVPRVVVDLEGGGRVFLEMTDCDPKEVTWGMEVETTFRCLHEWGGYHNYYWRARPLRTHTPRR